MDIIESNKPLRPNRDTTLLRGPRPKPEAFQDDVGFRRCCGARICRRSGAGNRCFGYIKTAYLVIGGYYSSVEYSHVGLNFETGKLYLELKWR